MQFHYVVGYDSEHERWWVESDTTAYLSDGNIWSQEVSDKEGYGWFVPEEGSPEEALDHELLNTLAALVDVIPIPKGA